MSPILQTLANSSAYGYRAFAEELGDFQSIATVTVGSGGSSSISFTSIPSTYQHLQIRALARLNNSGANGTGILRYNSDTNTNNYTYHEIVGNGASVSVYGSAAPESNQLVGFTGGTALTGNFGAVVTDILDYANANKYKTMRNLGGYDNNGSGQMRLNSGLWMNTATITSITITPNVGTAFVEYSQFALYGIKG
jgi:hypothetical protein